MSDIAVPKPILDEYSSVSRAKCACGATAFVVERQRLVKAVDHYSDWLDAKCQACGATRTFVFPLPSFGKNPGQSSQAWTVSTDVGLSRRDSDGQTDAEPPWPKDPSTYHSFPRHRTEDRYGLVCESLDCGDVLEFED